jgi:putative endonuclease
MIGLYILHCNNNRYYVGSTNNLERRLFEHQNAMVKATKYLLPVKLAFCHPCETISQARRLEKQLKNKKSKKIIEQIIRDGMIKFTRV